MSKLETVAIVGVGRAGLQHARAASAIGLRVTAFSSLSESSQRAQAFSQEFPLARRVDLSDGSLSESADLLVLALPPEVTHDVVLRLAQDSRQLLVEKPLALSTSRVKAIAKVAEGNGCKITVGYNRRVYPAVRRLREVLASDPPRTAEVTVVEDIDFMMRTKGTSSKAAYLRHGASTHMLDLSNFLFGLQNLTNVRPTLSNIEDGFVDYTFSYVGATGVHVQVSIDAGDRSRRGIRVVTSSGRVLALAPLEHFRMETPGDSMGSAEELDRLEFDYPISFVESFTTQMRLIMEDRTEDLHGIDDSLKLSEIVDGLELASKELRHE